MRRMSITFFNLLNMIQTCILCEQLYVLNIGHIFVGEYGRQPDGSSYGDDRQIRIASALAHKPVLELRDLQHKNKPHRDSLKSLKRDFGQKNRGDRNEDG